MKHPFYILFLRSCLFNMAFYSITAIGFIIGLPLLFTPQKYSFWVPKYLGRLVLWITKITAGIDYHVEGLENLPPAPFIIAAKHQSAWDTIVFHMLFPNLSFVIKKELSFIPLYGQFTKKLGMIEVSSKSGTLSLRQMLAQARQLKAQKRPILIFPEGQRTLPFQKVAYQRGIAALYEYTNLPVIPVALNAGHFWGKRTFIKYPGTIKVHFMPPILPGLPREEFMEQLYTAIETATDVLERNL